ncbi:endonuclease [Tuwongella immobilis]|uniref:Endonuclease/exonuclease/phosphatase domain-containing protein n=1 Tax=Tuwongella immobilis TaxID=692036 RepID=A0A6C2YHV2_9BACT|nr:endonuclease [Tuwongella immobilis]VIP00944.1 endonuclease i : Uncharacterized protein OS=Blastopirellula marina DSM 3645 GN=DSM3645_15100 PE=4 SV=1: Endonuclease_1: Exo_endo_phos [Tuwongella immobilis]VTR97306.1 endonuclease i : Uncharacterized protein OS=Blastopirellula marina DSM 3645 GN=DSM3645_15100 PE=4 SV=1: Endonuclease_1: Exo_endo_phos [Tuwongella immobilis]
MQHVWNRGCFGVFAAILLFPLALSAQPIHPTKQGAALEELVRTEYSPTTIYSYAQARHHLFSNVANNNGKVRLIYSGVLYATTTIPPSTVVNTEHVWPQSKFGAANKEKKKCDLHHLYPSYSRINESRGNLPFAEIPDAQTQKFWNSPTYLTGIPGANIDDYSEYASGRFEPREASKGNVARAMFYFRTIYGNQGIDLNFFDGQKSTLLAWHLADPVDAEEAARNSRIAALQGKSNPFIDDATLAHRIFQPGGAVPNPVAAAPQPGDSSTNGTTPPTPAASSPTLIENGEYHIMTWNLEWFFDADLSDNQSQTAVQQSADSPAIYKSRVEQAGKVIRDCGLPHIIALQEIENEKVVKDLANEVKAKYGVTYQVGFVQGNDTSTEQDVAFLVRDLGATATFARIPNADYGNNNLYKVPSKHCVMTLTQSLPDGTTKKMIVINCHLKAGKDVADITQRKKQARVMNHYLTKQQQETPGLAVVVLGDMNTRKPHADTTAQTDMGVLLGMETNTPNDDLIDLHENIPAANRSTHPLGELDRIAINAVLADDVGFVFRQIVVRSDLMLATPGLSDHTPLVASFRYSSTPQP